MKFVMLVVVMLLVLLACAEPAEVEEQEGRSRAGFWAGLWHGIIAPLSFIWSLFDSDVAVYDVYNSGNWYVFGFLLGAGVFSMSVSSTHSSTTRVRSLPPGQPGRL